MEEGFPPGTVLLEKYRVESVLGRGGMGVVLRVTHLHLCEELAIKILSPQVGGGPEVHARFLREAQSAIRLRGEHVARVGDVGVLPGGAPYMVMEYLRGADLSNELARRGTLPPAEVVDYVLQACEALAEAHALGIVHRDIKPSNLFLTQRPDRSPLVKVLDFGISKAPAGGPGVLTKTDTVMGTPGYMSPEQMKASKDVDARSDIWALGIVLYECLHGRRPFEAETYSATVLRAATEPPPPMDPRLPRELQAVILRCLEKDRVARFESTAELSASLAPFAGDLRAAALVVDRTRVMLGGATAADLPVRVADRSETATTRQDTASARLFTRRVWYALIGAVPLAGVIGAVIVVAMHGSHSTPDRRSVASAKPVAPAMLDAGTGDRIARGDDASIAPPSDAARDPAGAPAVQGGAVIDANAKAQACTVLESRQRWTDLKDCAGQLAALGVHDPSVQAKAEELRKKAVKEMSSSLAAERVRDAIAADDLPEAQKQLKSIGADSVYFAAASEAIRVEEERAITDYRRQAQALANAHNCAGLQGLMAKAKATGVPNVVDAVAAMTCSERTQPASKASSGNGPVAVAAAKPGCNTVDVNDAMLQAHDQYAAGFSWRALQLLIKALACKQDVRLYRMAVIYACAAHDLDAATLYYAKVPTQDQPAVKQRCVQENLIIP
jgi:serine/threonine-protein kinase